MSRELGKPERGEVSERTYTSKLSNMRGVPKKRGLARNGHAAREILQFLIRMDYQRFSIAAKGALLPIPCNLETYDANLVAFPIERTEEFLSLLGQK